MLTLEDRISTVLEGSFSLDEKISRITEIVHPAPAESDEDKFDYIKQIIEQVFGYEFLSRKNKRTQFVLPRQLLHYFAFWYTGLTLTKIGLMSGYNHATVIHSIKCVQNDSQCKFLEIDCRPYLRTHYRLAFNDIQKRIENKVGFVSKDRLISYEGSWAEFIGTIKQEA